MSDSVLENNRLAWNRQVELGNMWTRPVSPEVIAAARRGEWQVLLTGGRPVPRAWFPAALAGKDVLCLASAGGQQGPVLSAAGARVTVYDLSDRQLAGDRLVAEREGLDLRLIQGDMRDLRALADASFDLVFHPVSNIFVPDILPVWREAYRVLRPGGVLLAGQMNPVLYIFDPEEEDHGRVVVRYRLPYSDLKDLSEAERARNRERGYPLEFSHSLNDALDGQIAAGFLITHLYEDYQPERLLDQYFPTYLATRAVKVEPELLRQLGRAV